MTIFFYFVNSYHTFPAAAPKIYPNLTLLLSANLYDIELGYVNAMYLGVRENLAFS
jgi:hypothetical protein